MGQNFLIHEDSAQKIANWAQISEGDAVLEIGPGLGQLTNALGKRGAYVTAVEKDARLFEHLQKEWEEATWLKLMKGDALEIRLIEFLRPLQKKFKIVSNLPYSISTPLIEHLLDQKEWVEEMTFLLQEEVVDRITAQPDSREYGRLSIWVQTLCEVERGPKIPKGSFLPMPDVESRLIRLVPRTIPLVPENELDPFLKLTALLFQHRRKTVRNSLRDAGFEPIRIDQALTKAGVVPARRPQTLSIQEIRLLNDSI